MNYNQLNFETFVSKLDYTRYFLNLMPFLTDQSIQPTMKRKQTSGLAEQSKKGANSKRYVEKSSFETKVSKLSRL